MSVIAVPAISPSEPLRIRSNMTESRYRSFLAYTYVVAFMSGIIPYLYSVGILSIIKPVMLIALLMAAIVPLFASSSKRLFLPVPLLLSSSVFLGISVLGLGVLDSRPDSFAVGRNALVSQLEWVVIMLLGFLICSDPTARRSASRAAVAVVIINSAINGYELVHPGTFSTVAGRSAGFYWNANDSAIALVIGMLFGQFALPAKLRGAFYLIAGIGVFSTFSRSGMLFWGLVLALSVASDFNSRQRVSTIGGLLAIFTIVLVVLFTPLQHQILTPLQSSSALNDSSRILLLSKLSSLESDDRVALVQEYWNGEARSRPLFGYGTGASMLGLIDTNQGPHNMYVALLVDHGVIGLAILPLLVLGVLWNEWRRNVQFAFTFAVLVLGFGIFTHNMLQQWQWAVAFGLAGAYLHSFGASTAGISDDGQRGERRRMVRTNDDVVFG